MPPLTLDSLHERIPTLKKEYRETLWHIEDRMDQLEKALISINQDLHCLNPEVESNICLLRDGAIEAAHQSVVLGGPSYILNKAVTANQVAKFCQDKGIDIGVFFCVADYDSVQSELTNIRIPVMGSGGTLISIPTPEGFEFSPVNVIPLPRKDWYDKVEDDIRDSYRPMFKPLEGPKRLVFEERLEQALAVSRWGFLNSKTLGEWAMRIMGRLFNIEGNLGIPLVPASTPEVRDLLIEGMELLLDRSNRERMIDTFNDVTSLIESNGYNPGVGPRATDYVPFFYECPEKECNSARTELHYEDHGSTAVLTGKCPICSENIEIETPSESPYLGDIARHISPRVDSRQLVIDTIIPTMAHIGGPGETAYYAQVIPSAKAMGLPFPEFIKYPRVYFNTPWNESLAKSLEEKDIKVLHGSNLFSSLGKLSRFRKKNRFEDMNEELVNFTNLLLTTHSDLNRKLAEIDTDIGQSSKDEIEFLQSLKLEIERYLSWTFGQYAEEKFGQESSWSWIEWAINSGFVDLFGPYERAYVGQMKNGATVFVNFSI